MSSLKHRLVFITSLIVPLSTGACASAPARSNPWAVPGPTAHTFLVENNSWQNLTVFVVRPGGAFYGLGRVESLRSGTFTVPTDFTLGSDVQLVARSAFAGAQGALSSIQITHATQAQMRNRGEYITAPFALVRAMQVRWIINNEDRISQVFIR